MAEACWRRGGERRLGGEVASGAVEGSCTQQALALPATAKSHSAGQARPEVGPDVMTDDPSTGRQWQHRARVICVRPT
jgi:hypothetical protein